MNNYLDLLATKNIDLSIKLELVPVTNNGASSLTVVINNTEYCSREITEPLVIDTTISLLDNLCIEIAMSNKRYCVDQETSVIVKSFTVDGHELVGIHNCNCCISYQKDQDSDYVGFYLGFNGVWQFKLDQPFYRWWHTASGQGWLLEPAPIKLI